MWRNGRSRRKEVDKIGLPGYLYHSFGFTELQERTVGIFLMDRLCSSWKLGWQVHKQHSGDVKIEETSRWTKCEETWSCQRGFHDSTIGLGTWISQQMEGIVLVLVYKLRHFSSEPLRAVFVFVQLGGAFDKFLEFRKGRGAALTLSVNQSFPQTMHSQEFGKASPAQPSSGVSCGSLLGKRSAGDHDSKTSTSHCNRQQTSLLFPGSKIRM